MTDDPVCLAQYLGHLTARLRAQSRKLQAPLPQCVSEMKPHDALAVAVEALEKVNSPNLIQAVGDGLVQDLLNEHASLLGAEVADLLRTNQRFRFAFACGSHASVDPAIINEWVEILRDLGTTKQAERKRLWSARGGLREA